jgi:endonuclease YncB( thermonuclease family)
MLAAALAMGLPGLLTAAPASSATTRTSATVIRWVDGDTVVTSRGTVRLIGMNSPEKGRCGYSKALANARRLAPAGTKVTLVRVSTTGNRDRYDRLLRYVKVGSLDVGFRQIVAGSKAAYDSGQYGTHPRRADYRAADKRFKDYTCTTASTAPAWQRPVSASNPDLDCADIGRRVWVGQNDYHGLDADGDGWGCDSY